MSAKPAVQDKDRARAGRMRCIMTDELGHFTAVSKVTETTAAVEATNPEDLYIQVGAR